MMTTLYNMVHQYSGDNLCFYFDTDDDYPHIGDMTTHHVGQSFHVLRGGEKSRYTRDTLMIILKFALHQFEFEYKTTAPQVVDNEHEMLELEGINAALIKYENYFIVSTVVTPISGDRR